MRNELENHLTPLQRQDLASGWHDRRIGPGTEWQGQVDDHLNSSGIILLLISSDFMASDYCYDTEMARALERHGTGEARVIPVILRACDWTISPLAKLQALPKDGKPITSWPNRDEAFLDVARGIRRAIADIAGSEAGIVEENKPAGVWASGMPPKPATPSRKPQVAPHIFIGTAFVNRIPAVKGTLVTASDGKMETGSTMVAEAGSYTLMVTVGQARDITFRIDNLVADQTETWCQGGANLLELTASVHIFTGRVTIGMGAAPRGTKISVSSSDFDRPLEVFSVNRQGLYYLAVPRPSASTLTFKVNDVVASTMILWQEGGNTRLDLAPTP